MSKDQEPPLEDPWADAAPASADAAPAPRDEDLDDPYDEDDVEVDEIDGDEDTREASPKDDTVWDTTTPTKRAGGDPTADDDPFAAAEQASTTPGRSDAPGSPVPDENADVADLSYEKARDELTGIVSQLESGRLSLEESMRLWRRGEALFAHCSAWLDKAQEQIQQATAGRQQ